MDLGTSHRDAQRKLGTYARVAHQPGRSRLLHGWVVLYDNQFDLPVAERLALCDKVTFWTWEARNLDHLEANVARFEALVPEPERRLLGCYMWDFGGTQGPMPIELMRKQCELGRQWIGAGRIDGMVFLSSCLCDLDLEAVEWTREWICKEGR